MIEFVQNYGLWIALAGVFVAMHWFGRGCCGGGHRHRPIEGTKEALDAAAGEGPPDKKTSGAVPRSKGGCH